MGKVLLGEIIAREGSDFDPDTNLPKPEAVEALAEAIISPYEVDQLTAYQLGKI